MYVLPPMVSLRDLPGARVVLPVTGGAGAGDAAGQTPQSAAQLEQFSTPALQTPSPQTGGQAPQSPPQFEQVSPTCADPYRRRRGADDRSRSGTRGSPRRPRSVIAADRGASAAVAGAVRAVLAVLADVVAADRGARRRSRPSSCRRSSPASQVPLPQTGGQVPQSAAQVLQLSLLVAGAVAADRRGRRRSRRCSCRSPRRPRRCRCHRRAGRRRSRPRSSKLSSPLQTPLPQESR